MTLGGQHRSDSEGTRVWSTHVFDGLERDFFSEQAEVEHARFREQVEDGWGVQEESVQLGGNTERLLDPRSVMPIPARRIGERPILGAIALPVNSVIGLLSCSPPLHSVS